MRWSRCWRRSRSAATPRRSDRHRRCRRPGCAPPTDGRVALWRGEGTAEDSVGLHDGTLLNGGGYEPGIVGSAFSLPGGDDHVAVPDAADLDVTGDLTLDTWVRLDDENFGNPGENGAGGDRVIFWKLDDHTHDTLIRAVHRGRPGHRGCGAAALPHGRPLRGGWVGLLRAARLAPGHLVPRRGHPQRQHDHLLPRRRRRGTASVSLAGRATEKELALGVAPQDGELYNPLLGDLDEPAIWSRALTGAEVKAINDTGTGACRVVRRRRPSAARAGAAARAAQPHAARRSCRPGAARRRSAAPAGSSRARTAATRAPGRTATSRARTRSPGSG